MRPSDTNTRGGDARPSQHRHGRDIQLPRRKVLFTGDWFAPISADDWGELK